MDFEHYKVYINCHHVFYLQNALTTPNIVSQPPNLCVTTLRSLMLRGAKGAVDFASLKRKNNAGIEEIDGSCAGYVLIVIYSISSNQRII